jgi:hypothetical protein
VADQDIVLRDPGGGVGAISFGGTPPIVGDAAVDLPALAAAAVGHLRLLGVAAVTLPALTASAAGELALAGTAAAELPSLEADGDGALSLSGTGAAALPVLTASADGQQILLGSAAVALPELGASATGTLALVGSAAVVLPGLTASASGSFRFVGVGAVSLPVLGLAAVGFVEPPDGSDEPGFISLPRAGALYEIALPAVASLYTITIARPMARLHIGDTALIEGITVRDSDGALVDPTTLTVLVLTPNGTEVELVYGTAPTSGDADAIIRTAAGTFDVQIEITEERGAGVYRYTVVTTGARAAEPGTFTVYARAV